MAFSSSAVLCSIAALIAFTVSHSVAALFSAFNVHIVVYNVHTVAVIINAMILFHSVDGPDNGLATDSGTSTCTDGESGAGLKSRSVYVEAESGTGTCADTHSEIDTETGHDLTSTGSVGAGAGDFNSAGTGSGKIAYVAACQVPTTVGVTELLMSPMRD